VSAEPATLLIALELFGFERILAALEATDLEVLSLLDFLMISIFIINTIFNLDLRTPSNQRRFFFFLFFFG
jgi:hypothetical protein